MANDHVPLPFVDVVEDPVLANPKLMNDAPSTQVEPLLASSYGRWCDHEMSLDRVENAHAVERTQPMQRGDRLRMILDPEHLHASLYTHGGVGKCPGYSSATFITRATGCGWLAARIQRQHIVPRRCSAVSIQFSAPGSVWATTRRTEPSGR